MSEDLAAIVAKLQRPVNGAVRSRVILTVDEAEAVAAVLGWTAELERALVRRDEVIDIAKLQSVCWFSLTTGQSHDAPRCGGCGSCLLFAALMEFDRQEQEASRG